MKEDKSANNILSNTNFYCHNQKIITRDIAEIGWRKINELEGHKVEYKNFTDERIIQKVVREVEDDKFIAI